MSQCIQTLIAVAAPRVHVPYLQDTENAMILMITQALMMIEEVRTLIAHRAEGGLAMLFSMREGTLQMRELWPRFLMW